MSIPKTRSKRFVQWCESHHVDVDEQVRNELLVYPTSVTFLANAMDSRAAAIFRLGLKSNNRGVALGSAYGLASLGQHEDVAAVVNLLNGPPATLHYLAASVLATFEGSEARLEIRKLLTPGSNLEKEYLKAVAIRDNQTRLPK